MIGLYNFIRRLNGTADFQKSVSKRWDGDSSRCGRRQHSGSEALAGPDESKQLATLIDISKCIGCEACVEACNEVNADKFPDPKKPFPKMYPQPGAGRRLVRQTGCNRPLDPLQLAVYPECDVEINGEETELTIPRRCMHCVNPPCVKLCPWGAAKQLENGISRIDSDLCLGGSKCKKVCPWDIPQRQTGVGLYLDLLPVPCRKRCDVQMRPVL